MAERLDGPRRLVAATLVLACVLAGGAARGEGLERPSGAAAEDGRAAAARPGRPAPLTAHAVLPGVDADVPMTVERARTLREAVRIAREDAEDALLRERIACYRRFMINGCLADVRGRERQVEARLDRIEVAVSRTLREADAFELNRREASEIEVRERQADEDAARREENRRAFEEKVSSAQAAQAQREADAPALERRAAANRAERERRDAENAAGRAEAARRAAGDAERAAARARELEAREREARARDEREAAQRARRREEAAQRELDAQRREAERERRPWRGAGPPAQPGSVRSESPAESAPPPR
jgi:colicin import membrane protein